MGSEKYNLIVNSAKISNDNIAEARKKMGSLFKLQASQLDKLFSGKPVRLFKDANHAVAKRYRDAILEIGIECLVEASSPKHERSSSASPQSSSSKFFLFDAEEKITNILQSYFCPDCQLQQENKTECEHCNYNLKIYRESMKEKGFIERPGVGYFPDRRSMHRRSPVVRREELRMGLYSDRRLQEEQRKEFGAY
jgi:hypothetical protein